MAEFALLVTIMAPLLFAIPMIGKLIDVRQTAVQASRYTAWETTVGVAPGAGNTVRGRFFTDPASPIVTDAGGTGHNRLWGDEVPTRVYGELDLDARVAVKSENVAVIEPVSARGGGGSVAAEMGGAVRDAGSEMESFSKFGDKTDWSLSGDGLTVSGVRVGIEQSGWLERLGPDCAVPGAFACLDELSVIMSDGWSASGTEQAEQRVRSLVPANALHTFGDAVSVAGKLPPFKDLEGLKNAFGHVDMSVLPPSENNARPLERYEEPR